MSMIEQHNTIIIVPARMASARLPGKPLADIHGVPMVVEVWKQAVLANIGHVLVAASENQIAEIVRKAGGDAIATEPRLVKDIDQVAAALSLRDAARRYRFIISLPCDLPAIDPLSLRRCLAGLTNESVDIATIASELNDAAAIADSHVVKAVAPLEGEREVAYARDFVRVVDQDTPTPYWQHSAVFAYRRDALERLSTTPISTRERNRNLEPMRALDNDMKIAVVKVDSAPLRVDTPQNLEALRQLLKVNK
jgi:3-deoxy-manno-octulosonate cytidylyltransferase (CMP-KDO synthetase)